MVTHKDKSVNTALEAKVTDFGDPEIQRKRISISFSQFKKNFGRTRPLGVCG